MRCSWLAAGVGLRVSAEHQQGEQAAGGAGVEGAGGAQRVPQQPGQQAGQQHGEAADQIEEAERAAAQFRGRAGGHHGGQQPLGHPQMNAPQHHPHQQ